MVADYAKELIGVAATAVSVVGGAALKWKSRTDTRLAALESKQEVLVVMLTSMKETQEDMKHGVDQIRAHLLSAGR